MTELTRRAVLTGAAATGAGAIGLLNDITPANAVAAQLGKQAPGFYRYKVGSLEVTVVTDGARSFPLPDNFVNNAYRDQVNAALEQAFMPKIRLRWFSTTTRTMSTGCSLPTTRRPFPTPRSWCRPPRTNSGWTMVK